MPAVGGIGRRVSQRRPDPVCDVRQAHLRFEGVVGTREGDVEGVEAAGERWIADDRLVHRGPDEVLAQHARLEVDDAFPVAPVRRRAAVVDDVGREHRDHRRQGGPLVPAEVVAHGAVVDDEQRPHVVRVGRVRVRREARVQHLADTRDRRLPGPDRRGCGARLVHRRRIVQDPPARRPLASDPVTEILALIGFAFVSSVTPGPNNVMLWASGATFGVRRTTPHVVGTAIGIGAMAVAVAFGLGAVIAAVPALGFAMKLAGSAYLLYLAIQIARSGGLTATTVSRPLGVVEAASFQLINPKAWVFALGAMTTFRPAGLPVGDGRAARRGDDDAGDRAHGGAVGGRRRRAEPPDLAAIERGGWSASCSPAIVAATVVWVWA